MGFKFDIRSVWGRAADSLFALGLTQTATFHGGVRPILHGHAEGDIVKAQQLAIEGLHAYLPVVQRCSDGFLKRFNARLSYEGLMVDVAGRRTTPVGTAPGLDCDAEGLLPLSYLFGFQMPGPVTLLPQTMPAAPFRDDNRRRNLYVPTHLPSKGLVHVRENLRQYRATGGSAILLPAITASAAVASADEALAELAELAEGLAPEADGLVWSGPQRIPSDQPREMIAAGARRMASLAAGRLKLLELPAPESEEKQEQWLELAEAFLAAGGDGILAVSGCETTRAHVPRSDDWPFETAMVCGAAAAAPRRWAIEALRRRFPGAFLAACGGIHDRDEALDACRHANVIAECEAFTRYGPGLARALLHKLASRLHFLQRSGQIESASLEAFQRQAWSAAAAEENRQTEAAGG